MAPRSYRWLLVTLAVVGLAADQGTKYGVFRWLYNGGRPTADDAGVRFGQLAVPPGTPPVYRGDFEVAEGWFRLTAEFTDAPAPHDGRLRALQTWSGPKMPRVNHGALFGMGGDYKGDANTVFAVVSVVAAVGILGWAARRQTAADGWLCAALGLILGGTVGNLYDRVVFDGVRDFLHFYYIDWPVFNVADCGLVAGAGMLLVHAFLTPSQPAVPAAAEPVAAAAK